MKGMKIDDRHKKNSTRKGCYLRGDVGRLFRLVVTVKILVGESFLVSGHTQPA